MKDEINCEKIVNGELKELPDVHKEYLWTMLIDYKNPHEAKQFELRSERLEKMGYDVKRFIHVYKKVLSDFQMIVIGMILGCIGQIFRGIDKKWI